MGLMDRLRGRPEVPLLTAIFLAVSMLACARQLMPSKADLIATQQARDEDRMNTAVAEMKLTKTKEAGLYGTPTQPPLHMPEPSPQATEDLSCKDIEERGFLSIGGQVIVSYWGQQIFRLEFKDVDNKGQFVTGVKYYQNGGEVDGGLRNVPLGTSAGIELDVCVQPQVFQLMVGLDNNGRLSEAQKGKVSFEFTSGNPN